MNIFALASFQKYNSAAATLFSALLWFLYGAMICQRSQNSSWSALQNTRTHIYKKSSLAKNMREYNSVERLKMCNNFFWHFFRQTKLLRCRLPLNVQFEPWRAFSMLYVGSGSNVCLCCNFNNCQFESVIYHFVWTFQRVIFCLRSAWVVRKTEFTAPFGECWDEEKMKIKF